MNWIVKLTLMTFVVTHAATGLAQGRDSTRSAPTPSTGSRDSSAAMPGEDVRFLIPAILNGMQHGKFREWRGDQLVVDPRNRPELREWMIPISQLERLEARRGHAGTQAGRGALWGTLIGALLISGTGAAIVSQTQPEYSAVTAFVLAPAGAGLGAIMGALVGRTKKGQHWFALKIPQAADTTVRR